MPRHSTTLVLQTSSVQGDVEVYRHLGVDSSLTLRDLHRVLGLSFGLIDAPSPWGFTLAGRAISADALVGDHLGAAGAELTYHWGLWQVRLHTIDASERDPREPRARCVGGSGSFRHAPFDLHAINAALASLPDRG